MKEVYMDKKRTYLLILIGLLIIFISGCVGIPMPGADEAAIGRAFFRNEQDDLIHKVSKAVFPKEFTNFIRNDQKIYLYDENALDVSVEYTFKHSPGIATIYVYPAPAQLNDNILMTEYERCKQDVYKYKNVIKLLREQTSEYTASNQLLPSRFAAFHIHEGEQLYSLVTLTGKNTWFVLFRTTFPLKGSDEKLRDMMSTFPREFNYSAIQ
jgi:hypothetical protein